MAPPRPRLTLVLERTGDTIAIASWELPSNNAVDVTPGQPGISDAVFWASAYQPQQGPDNMGSSALLFGADNVTATVTTRYLPAGYALGSAPSNMLEYVVPIPMVLRNLRVRHNNPQGNGEAIVYTLLVDGIATALFASLASTDTDGSNLVNSVAVAAGQRIAIEVTKALGVGTSPMEITASLEAAAA